MKVRSNFLSLAPLPALALPVPKLAREAPGKPVQPSPRPERSDGDRRLQMAVAGAEGRAFSTAVTGPWLASRSLKLPTGKPNLQDCGRPVRCPGVPRYRAAGS